VNDAADEPQKASFEGSSLAGRGRLVNIESVPFWKPSAEQLQDILEKHEEWLGENGDDNDPRRAVLIRADLRDELCDEKVLQDGQYAILLRKVNLQKAYLIEAQLQGASLRFAQLQKANLIAAQLQGASLSDAQLLGATLSLAQLQRANLSRAQLQGAWLARAQLQGADLSRAQLQGADLSRAQLRGARLSNAQLQGANLYKAHLRQADLTGANFERLAVTEDGEPGQELPAADLTDANFRDADLSNAELSTVTGLRAEMLVGAVLTNAKLPEHVARFDRLTHAAETSKHAGTTFFALLAASFYSWLTIGTTTDVALITGAASSPLPIINTNIALSGFYWVAPLILLGFYFYLQLYLQRLWRDLSTLPAVFQDGEPLDEKAYPWLLNGLVRAHFTRLKLSERPLSRLENLISIALTWWVVPLTLVAFWLRYLPRHDWWGTVLHTALITIAVGFGVQSYRLAVRTLSGTGEPSTPGQDEPLWTWIWRGIRSFRPDRWTILALSLALVLSAGVWIDPGDDLLTRLGYETGLDLTDDDVSAKPSGWTGQEETAEVEIAQVKGANLEGRDLRQTNARGAFLVKANLAGADLRRAHLWYADLREADLSRADLSGASFIVANLEGANLEGANLTGANLTSANLEGADLGGTDLSGANLWGAAHLTQAQLSQSRRANGRVQRVSTCGDDKTRLPEGLTIETCPVTAPQRSPPRPAGPSIEWQPR
jgi:uncharacterized protein YjbI with pentapeptide repeats